MKGVSKIGLLLRSWFRFLSLSLSLSLSLIGLVVSSCASTSKKSEGQRSIESFYQSYFESLSLQNKPKPTLNLSTGFLELIAKNRAHCKEKAGTDLCGWDALHGGDYLNAQEIDSDLNFENSGFKSIETGPDIIRVEFNVYPSAKENKKQYNRSIEYKLIRESTLLVVDDIISDGKSMRKRLMDEMEHYR